MLKYVLFIILFSYQSVFANQRLWAPPTYGVQSARGYDVHTFATPEPLKKEVDFWIQIYTKYTTKQGVFHRSGNIDEIIGEID